MSLYSGDFEKYSSVSMVQSFTIHTGIRQLETGLSFSRTVQNPHFPSSQPIFTEISFLFLRTKSSFSSGASSKIIFSPFIVMGIFIFLNFLQKNHPFPIGTQTQGHRHLHLLRVFEFFRQFVNRIRLNRHIGDGLSHCLGQG